MAIVWLDTCMAIVWLIIRVYVGYQWFSAGLVKLTGTSIDFGSFGEKGQGRAWVFTNHDGAAMAGFVKGALAETAGAHASVQGWYANFLQTFVQPMPASGHI